MDNKTNRTSSFFRRPKDAEENTQDRDFEQRSERSPGDRYESDDRATDNSTDEPRGGNWRPRERPASSGSRSGERGARTGAARGPRASERGNREAGKSDKGGKGGDWQPRGDRRDFRSDDNRQPQKEREAPENVIFGIHPVREAIDIGQPIEKIYIRRVGDDRESGARKGAGSVPMSNNTALEEIKAMAAHNNIPVQDVPVEKLDRLTRRNNHQGVVAVTPPIEYADINEIIDKLANAETPALIVALDGITDVRNFGAIARSAECAGADALVISAKSSAPVNSEAMKSSAGALSIIPVSRVGSLRNTLKQLQMTGMKLIAATEKCDTLVYEADFKGPSVIILGSEDKGISPDILRMCDYKTAIPLLGKIESLNVSAAGAILLFEAVRQRFEAE